MMVRFTTVENKTDFQNRHERVAIPQFSLGEAWINPIHIVSLRPANSYRNFLQEGRLPKGLSQEHEFTAISVNNGNEAETFIVLGEHSDIILRLSNLNSKQLLKG
tara:strand:+ start:2826 stop:3140 length:315 start_codon:yes stop_codon:yes gene_type:complete